VAEFRLVQAGSTRGTVAALALASLLWLSPSAAAAPDPAPAGANDFTCKPSRSHPRPVVLVHGLSATQGTNWSYMSPRIAAAGYCVFSLTYGRDPRLDGFPYSPGGVLRMQQSSKELKAFVARVLRRTGARRVDLVGHSEGTVMPRWYLERRNGARHVKRFVALTPLWRGTEVGGTALLRDLAKPYGLSGPLIDLVASFCGSCPQFLRGSGYLDELNRDGEAVPGVRHTNIATMTDELVVPYTSGLMLDGGRNIVLQEVCPTDLSDHAAVAFDPVVLRLVLNALKPRAAKPVSC
jgi:triacylglycerol lipase